jgi:sirohydrochlorin cobaltochelatase
VSLRDLSDAALVLVGHGTTLNEDSAAPVFHHAAEIRRRRTFAEVREGFWKQPPLLLEVVDTLRAQRVFVVPFFMSEGYFCERVIPRELGFAVDESPAWSRTLQRGKQTLFYCKPVGTHPSITQLLVRRAQQILKDFPFPRPPRPENVSFFIAGHGTEREENSRKAVERQVELIRAMGLYSAVQAIFLEEAPRIATCYDTAPTRHIVVVPFFISDGLHVAEDIPVLLGEPERVVRQRLQTGHPAWRNPSENKGKLVWYAPGMGSDPQMTEIILDRVREAAEWSVIR